MAKPEKLNLGQLLPEQIEAHSKAHNGLLGAYTEHSYNGNSLPGVCDWQHVERFRGAAPTSKMLSGKPLDRWHAAADAIRTELKGVNIYCRCTGATGSRTCFADKIIALANIDETTNKSIITF